VIIPAGIRRGLFFAGAEILFLAVMMGVRLAGLGRVMMGVMAMARRGMGMMCRRIGIFLFIMLGGFAVMMRRLFMMFGGGMVMAAGGMFLRHGLLLENAPGRRGRQAHARPATLMCQPA
jgi:hypothetical protein